MGWDTGSYAHIFVQISPEFCKHLVMKPKPCSGTRIKHSCEMHIPKSLQYIIEGKIYMLPRQNSTIHRDILYIPCDLMYDFGHDH